MRRRYSHGLSMALTCGYTRWMHASMHPLS